jgi:hypothetical protein
MTAWQNGGGFCAVKLRYLVLVGILKIVRIKLWLRFAKHHKYGVFILNRLCRLSKFKG